MVLLPRILDRATASLSSDNGLFEALFAKRDYLMGMMVTAIVPAIIWCGLLAAVDTAFTIGIPSAIILAVGVSITMFLAAIYACLARSND